MLLGGGLTIKTCVTFGNEAINAAINTVAGKTDILLAKLKCLSAVNQPFKNIHEEQKHSLSAKPLSNMQFSENICSDLLAQKED